jgi:hypothetical protein
VYVDASVFTKADAFGRISGTIDLSVIPQVGDLMAFGPHGSASDFVAVDLLRVTNKIIHANGDDVNLSLDDITVETEDDARAVLRFLEDAYNLFGEVWQDDS